MWGEIEVREGDGGGFRKTWKLREEEEVRDEGMDESRE